MKKKLTLRRLYSVAVPTYKIEKLSDCFCFSVGNVFGGPVWRVGDFLTEKELQRVFDGEIFEKIEVLAPKE